MTVYIISTKVKQFNYYLHFPHADNGSYKNYTLQGLKNNATTFKDQIAAYAVASNINTDRELFIETLSIQTQKTFTT